LQRLPGRQEKKTDLCDLQEKPQTQAETGIKEFETQGEKRE
jgi:hypothetical protein